MSHIYKLYTGVILFLLLVAVLLGACTKTEYAQLKKPYADIERFAIAGYGDLDSIPAVIHGDSILIYWNATNTPPLHVKPQILVSDGATITPASGTEVAFADKTVYTVTAEDGSVRKFILKPVFNKAIPTVVTMTATRTWSANTPIAITGEYFLTTGNTRDIKIYAQRVRDGFEFDLPFDTAGITATRINAYLPEFTSELDTGAHRVYVKVGGFSSNVAPIWLSQPILAEIIDNIDISKRGSINLGEDVELTFTPKPVWRLAFERYYKNENFSSLSLGLQKIEPGQVINGRTYSVPADYTSSREPGKIKLKIDPVFFAPHKSSRVFGGVIGYKNVSSINGPGGSLTYQFTLTEYAGIYEAVIEEVNYANIIFLQEGQPISRGQTLTLNYSFSDAAYHDTYNILSGIDLKFKNKAAGSYTSITVGTADIINGGSQLQFAVPVTADVAGQSLVAVGINLRSSTNNRIYITPRRVLSRETVVSD